jgi:hypothetical protein
LQKSGHSKISNSRFPFQPCKIALCIQADMYFHRFWNLFRGMSLKNVSSDIMGTIMCEALIVGINFFNSSMVNLPVGTDWRIFADFEQHLINLVQPLYAGRPLANLEEVDNDIFTLDSTSISVSLKLWKWAPGKYERGAVKMHTLLNVRSSIPTFILITDGVLKYFSN